MEKLKVKEEKNRKNGLLIANIATTILGGPLFGIPGIIFSIKTKKAAEQRDIIAETKWKKYSKVCLWLYVIGLVISIIAGLIILKPTRSEDGKITIGGIIDGKGKNDVKNDIDLANVNTSDYSTIPVYIENTPFTLPTTMEFIQSLDYTFEDETVGAGAYINIEATKGESTITLTCKNTDTKTKKVSECVVVSTYFTKDSTNASLYGIKVGDDEKKIEETLGKCDNIQSLENGAGWKSWKDYMYKMDEYNIYSEFTVIDGKIISVLFKYEVVEKAAEETEEEDIEEDVESEEDLDVDEDADVEEDADSSETSNKATESNTNSSGNVFFK